MCAYWQFFITATTYFPHEIPTHLRKIIAWGKEGNGYVYDVSLPSDLHPIGFTAAAAALPVGRGNQILSQQALRALAASQETTRQVWSSVFLSPSP